MKFFLMPTVDAAIGSVIMLTSGSLLYRKHSIAKREEERRSKYENEFLTNGFEKVQIGTKIKTEIQYSPYGSSFFAKSEQPQHVWRDKEGRECKYDESYGLKK